MKKSRLILLSEIDFRSIRSEIAIEGWKVIEHE